MKISFKMALASAVAFMFIGCGGNNEMLNFSI